MDEVVTTLMLNFIAISLTAYLVNGPLLAPGSANSATPMVDAAARLPKLMPPSTLNAGFLIALALLVLYWLWDRNTVSGFETRIAGLNSRFAIASGIDVPMLIIKMMVLSGAIGGIAGGIHALGSVGRFVSGFSPGTASPASRSPCSAGDRLSGSSLQPSSSERLRHQARRSSSFRTCRSRS